MKLGRIMKARIEDGGFAPRTAGMHHWTLVLMAALTLGGCAGDDEFIGATTAGATTGASPLQEVARDLWTSAPAGCEGMLDDLEWSFGVAEGAPELVVVLDPYGGAAICTDTYSAIDAELRATGSDEVDSLWLSYVNTLQEMEVYSGMTRSSQATDQDGSVVTGANDPAMGEPNPQPSRPGPSLSDIETADDEPNPQPSMPEEDGPSDGAASNESSSDSSVAPLRPNTEATTETVAPIRQTGGM